VNESRHLAHTQPKRTLLLFNTSVSSGSYIHLSSFVTYALRLNGNTLLANSANASRVINSNGFSSNQSNFTFSSVPSDAGGGGGPGQPVPVMPTVLLIAVGLLGMARRAK
jgi:hypothetical protein